MSFDALVAKSQNIICDVMKAILVQNQLFDRHSIVLKLGYWLNFE